MPQLERHDAHLTLAYYSSTKKSLADWRYPKQTQPRFSLHSTATLSLHDRQGFRPCIKKLVGTLTTSIPTCIARNGLGSTSRRPTISCCRLHGVPHAFVTNIRSSLIVESEAPLQAARVRQYRQQGSLKSNRRQQRKFLRSWHALLQSFHYWHTYNALKRTALSFFRWGG